MARTRLQENKCQEFKSSLVETVRTFLIRASTCRCAVVKLPHTNEDGQPVVHRDNLEMLEIASRCAHAAQVFYCHLSDEDALFIDRTFKDWRKLL
jgi:hypothetical protein